MIKRKKALILEEFGVRLELSFVELPLEALVPSSGLSGLSFLSALMVFVSSIVGGKSARACALFDYV